MKIYQEDLEEGKKADIVTQPSSSKLRGLQPEGDEPLPQQLGQVKVEEKVITSKARPSRNKMPESLDEPLESEPSVKVNVRKPEPRGSQQPSEEHEFAVDR